MGGGRWGRDGIEAAIHTAVPLPAGTSLADPRADVVRQVELRQGIERLLEVAAELTADQRLGLAGRVALGMRAQDVTARFGWSSMSPRVVVPSGAADVGAGSCR